ncbi:MAG: hypothetical protein JWR52_2428 [Marmoricola sp.]|nr:hypothetical protein [Marmoricola sp.]
MLRRTPVLAVLLSLAITVIGVSPTQAVAPNVTAITVSNTTIYPGINTAQRPGSTTITVDATDPSNVAYVDIRDSADTLVLEISMPSGSSSVPWNGRDTGGALVAAGNYTILALSSAKEAAPTTGTVAVSRQHLIAKTFTATIAANRYVYKNVGRCSTLRRPSRRGWAGSLGYYANTRCGAQTWAASRVITIHAVHLPAAERYLDLRVQTYGGAARAKPNSRALVDYWSSSQQTWIAGKFIASKVGWHPGLAASPSALIFNGGWINWRLSTAFKSQYDVAKYTVVMHYDVLSAS